MSKFSNRHPGLAFGAYKIDPLSDIRNAGIITSGDVFWVKKETDANIETVKDSVGAGVLRDTFNKAIDLCEDDHNDYVLVCPGDGGTNFSEGTAVDMDTARVHLLAVGAGRHPHKYAVTLEGYAVTAMDDEIIHVTAEGCEIGGLKLLGTAGTGSGGTMDNGLLYLSGSAHDLWVHDCMIENESTQWDDNLPVGIVNSAASQHGARFDNCLIGGTVAEASGTQTPVVCSASGQRWEFNNCKFMMIAGNSGQKFAVVGTGLIDYTSFDNCQFINTDQGNLPDSVLTGNITDDQGIAVMHYCSGVNVTAFGTDDNVWVVPTAKGTAGAGLTNPGIGIIGTCALVTA